MRNPTPARRGRLNALDMFDRMLARHDAEVDAALDTMSDRDFDKLLDAHDHELALDTMSSRWTCQAGRRS